PSTPAHKADHLQRVAVLQHSGGVLGFGDDVPIALHGDAAGFVPGRGQKLRQGLARRVLGLPIDCYHIHSSFLDKRKRGYLLRYPRERRMSLPTTALSVSGKGSKLMTSSQPANTSSPGFYLTVL